MLPSDNVRKKAGKVIVLKSVFSQKDLSEAQLRSWQLNPQVRGKMILYTIRNAIPSKSARFDKRL